MAKKVKKQSKNWRKVKLGEVINLNPQVQLKKGKEYSFIPMDIINGVDKYIKSGIRRKFKGGGTKFIEGDVLFARITPCLEHGKVAVTKELEGKVGFGSTEYFIVRGKEKITDTNFLYYLLKTNKLKQTAINSMVGASGRQRAKIEAIKEYELNLPSFSEQKRITAILSAFDDKIELNNKINRNLEQMAQMISKELFTMSKDGKLPKGWRNGKLGDLMEIRKERFKKYEEWKNLKLLDLGRFPQKSLAITSYGKGEEIKTAGVGFKKRDILFGAVRPYFHKVVIAPFDGVTNSSVFVIISKKENYYALLVTVLFSENTINYASMSASGTKMPVIKWEDLCSMGILIPEEKIIDSFDKVVRNFYSVILKNAEENQKLSSLRDLLLPKLMSGKVKV